MTETKRKRKTFSTQSAVPSGAALSKNSVKIIKASKQVEAIKVQGNKAFGGGSFVAPSEGAGNFKQFYGTGIPALDITLTGTVGNAFCAGKFSGITGDYGTGKTTLGVLIARSVQAQGGITAFFDTEKTLSEDRIISLGLDPSRVIYAQEPAIENICAQIEFLLEKFGDTPGLIFWDTLASSSSLSDKGRKPGEEIIARHAKILAVGCRRIVGALAISNTALIMCNQLKHGGLGKLFVSEREKDAGLGGKAFQFHSSHILKLDNPKRVWRTKEKIDDGFSVLATITKSKTGSKRRQCRLVFDTRRDVPQYSAARSALLTLEFWKVIPKPGRYAYQLGGNKLTELKFIDKYESDSIFQRDVNSILEEAYAT